MAVYDDEKQAGRTDGTAPGQHLSDSSSSPAKSRYSSDNPWDKRQLRQNEEGAKSPSTTSAGRSSAADENPSTHTAGSSGGASTPSRELRDREEDAADKFGEGYTGGNSSSTSRLRNRFRITRKRAIIGVGSSTVVGATFAFLSISSGPFQFIHIAQFLQQEHFSANEDFGDSRSDKILHYALFNDGEQTRLGIKGNIAANVWEKQLEKSTGLKPAYSSTTRRFVGYVLADEDKAFHTLLSASDKSSKTSSHLDSIMGQGAEIKTVAEASAGKQAIVLGGGQTLGGKTRIIDLSGVKFSDRRTFIKTIGQFTGTWKVASPLGSRLLIKRAGVDFSPLKNIKRKATDKLADYIAERRKAKAEADATGTQSITDAHNPQTDKNGKPVESAASAQATDQTNSLVDKAKGLFGRDAIKQLAAKVKGGPVIGLLCGAKSMGSDVVKYKWVNNALPMIRMGVEAMTVGNNVMSGQNVNLDELGAYNQSFYNPKDGTSWTDARSVQAEMGKPQTGPDLPPEAQLKNINNKPKFFKVLDGIPLLGTTCSLNNALSSLPIIGDITNVASDAITGALNTVAGAFGTSVDEIVTSALSAMAGKSVDTLASGAPWGAFVDEGTFLGAAQNAMSMGGGPLSAASVAELNKERQIAQAQDNANKSFYNRYLNPYDNQTLVASMIDRMPTSASRFASSVSNVSSVFSGLTHNLATIFIPHSSAATQSYDYGLPPFGFSPSERDAPQFENPFDNALVIERPGVLDSLNSKYGQPCFGMTVTADDQGVHVQTEGMDSEDINPFKVVEKPECNPQTNSDPMFLRYRMYLADSVSTESLDCFEGQSDSPSDQSCADLGMDVSSGSSSSTATATAGNYTNPFPSGWTPGRLDMGYDGTFVNQIVAPFSGTITYASTSFANWGGYIELKANQPLNIPSNPGSETLYFAEGVKPAKGITNGATVVAGQPIADAFTNGAQAGIPGNIEFGVAKDAPTPGTPTDTYVFGQCGSASAKQAVLGFSNWVQQTLHVPAPSSTGSAGCP